MRWLLPKDPLNRIDSATHAAFRTTMISWGGPPGRRTTPWSACLGTCAGCVSCLSSVVRRKAVPLARAEPLGSAVRRCSNEPRAEAGASARVLRPAFQAHERRPGFFLLGGLCVLLKNSRTTEARANEFSDGIEAHSRPCSLCEKKTRLRLAVVCSSAAKCAVPPGREKVPPSLFNHLLRRTSELRIPLI